MSFAPCLDAPGIPLKSMRANGHPRRSSLTSALLMVPSHLENVVLSMPVVTTQNLATPSYVAFLFRTKNCLYCSTSWGSVSDFFVLLFPFCFKMEACSLTRLRMDAPQML